MTCRSCGDEMSREDYAGSAIYFCEGCGEEVEWTLWMGTRNRWDAARKESAEDKVWAQRLAFEESRDYVTVRLPAHDADDPWAQAGPVVSYNLANA